jgi:prepilin-type N-terminal cleavage/methylation domain-containing protein
MTRTRMHRPGFTLLELVIAMGIGTVLMGMLAVVMARVLVANAAAERHGEGIAALGRLGEQFRRDARAAADAKTEKSAGQPTRLRFDRLDGTQVEYEIAEAGLRRVVSAAGRVQHREMFVLPRMKILGWNEDFDATGEISLIVGRTDLRGDHEQAIASRFSISAPLGRDRRYGGSGQ